MKNLRESLFMVLSMGIFSLEDMFIKNVSGGLPLGEVMTIFGLGGTLIFCLLAVRRGEGILHPALLSKPILCRIVCEAAGRLFFTLAIVFAPLSSASAILQATPLFVALGAAILFKEKVGLRRWLIILIGFLGVLLILQPGSGSFEATSVLALLGTIGFAGRDLATRAAPPVLSNYQLGIYGFCILIPIGLAMQLYTGGFVWLDLVSFSKIMGAILLGSLAYLSLTIAMRTGEVSVVSPFRYSRILFGIGLGILVFNESPNEMALLGGGIVVLSGIFSLIDGQRANKAASSTE